MRQGTQIYWPPFTPLLKKLIVICAVIFIIQTISGTLLNFPFLELFSLVPRLLMERLFIWQLFTYMFLHGGILHLVVNMLMLWMFGGELESYWGSKRFIRFYLLAGIFSGLVSAISYYNAPIPIVGASGAIYALLVAYGFMFPNRKLLFFGIFPMQTKYFVMLICLMTFWVAFGESGGNVAHFAHLGGIAFGILYMKLGQWGNILKRYKTIKRDAEKDRLKSRFKIITDDMDKNEMENFWKNHKDDPTSWN